MKLLERDELLQRLLALQREAAAGPGRIVLVEGEAGIGKTSLLRAFAAALDPAGRLFRGACDPLLAPRPLAPLHDIALQLGRDGGTRLALDSDRHEAAGAFLRLLSQEPSVVLLEDVHWADEGTLDLLRFVGRRMESTRSLLVATLRDDEVGPSHPLRAVLGDLATQGAIRIAPARLSLAAVGALAAGSTLDVAEVHRRTGGNPFFVTEVLAAGRVEVPATVRDAVLARAARLRPSARAILDAAAVAGPRIEPWLLEDVVAAESRSIDECLASGVLAVQDGDYQFRHELARQTVLEALTPTRRLALHRLVLQALRPQDAAPRADPARLAHHAVGACDEAAILRWAPAAAREAAARGAHRQAAQQLERALGATPPGGTLRATLLDDLAAEQQFCGRLDAAIAARTEAAAMWRAAGDAGREAQSLARLAHSRVIAGQNAAGEAALDAARRLVRADDRAGAAASGDAPSPALLAVRRWSAYVRMLDRDVDAAIAEGEAALAAAEALGDDEAAMQCLNTIGSSLLVSGRIDAGRERLDRSRERAERLGADQWILNAWSNLGSGSGEAFAFDVAESALLRAIEYCAERDLDSGRLYSQAWLATVYLYRGRWQVAGELANAVATDPRSSGIARMMAHIALGRLRARRGDPGVGATLDEALRLAGGTGTLQRIAPMRAARAEAAWLEARDDAAIAEVDGALPLALQKRHAWFVAELRFWRERAAPPADAVHDWPLYCTMLPFALEARGDWRAAATAWRERGCPYETARALAGGDVEAQREALQILEQLGARPLAERVRRQLHSAGVRNLPRGPRESTLRHPAGLTQRELAVLVLLAEGLRNKEIAERLHRSARTVDHHVESIFAKLGAANRAEATAAAWRLGLLAPDSPARAPK